MNEKSLEKNLANLERELVALQTAHDVGLGAVGFYEYDGEGDTFSLSWSSQMFALLIDVEEGERIDPIMNVFVSSIYGDNDSGFAYIERVSSVKFGVFVMRPFAQSVHMYYKAVSSSRLRIKVASSEQEYEEWLND